MKRARGGGASPLCDTRTRSQEGGSAICRALFDFVRKYTTASCGGCSGMGALIANTLEKCPKKVEKVPKKKYPHDLLYNRIERWP